MANLLQVMRLANVAIPDDTDANTNYTDAIDMRRVARIESLLYRIASSSDVATATLAVDAQVSGDGSNWSDVGSGDTLIDDSGMVNTNWKLFKAVPDFKAPYIRFGLRGPAATNPADTFADLVIYARKDYE